MARSGTNDWDLNAHGAFKRGGIYRIRTSELTDNMKQKNAINDG